MPVFDLLWAYVEKGRVISGKPAHDDPAHWTKRVYNEVLGASTANIRFDGMGEGWALYFENLKSAGVTTWRYRGNIQAVALVITGLSDAVDADAVARCLKASASFFPAQSFKSALSKLYRPAAIQLSADREVFAQRLVSTVSIAIGKAIFEKVNVTTTRPPLGSGSRFADETIFAAQTYGSDGRLHSTQRLAWSGVASDRSGHEIIGMFEHGFTNVKSRLEFGIEAGAQKLKVTWQEFGKTAGVATVYNSTSADEPEATLLLLTGLDFMDDQATIEAYEKGVAARGMSGAWSKAFRRITTAQRPLLLRFLNDRTPPTKLGEKAAVCIAAAFFRRKKVL
jgi:hypothetical protein